MSVLTDIYDRVTGGNRRGTAVTTLIDVARELGCLSDLLGRDFEVRNPEGKLICTIKQKPITVSQFNQIVPEIERLRKQDNKSGRGGGRRGRG